MLSLINVQQVIDDFFLYKICSDVTDCIGNLTGEELQGVFEDDVDHAVCVDIEGVAVLSYDTTEYDDQTEISGEIEVKAELRGYIYLEDEEIDIGAVQKSISVSFLMYQNGGRYEDFEILEISL